MTDCREQSWLFQDLGSRKVEVDFGGGYLSSDGGGLILRELERHSGLLRDFSGCFVDYRDQRYIEHSVQELVSQRIHGLVLGYEDLNDHDHLRRDPIHGLIAGKSDPLGQDRNLERDKGKALAAHSTLNRLELSAEAIDARYHKIQGQPDEIEQLLIKRGVKAIPRKSAEIVLDFDATDDPLHGSQQGAYFHGYYRHYCYLPLYCFCGNLPLFAKLRDCKRDASDGTVEALQKIVPVIRQRFGKRVRIIVRADSGFAREAIMAWCEENGVFYCLGLARNDRLVELLGTHFPAGVLARGGAWEPAPGNGRALALTQGIVAPVGWWRPNGAVGGPGEYYSVLAQQRYAKSHRILVNCRGVRDFRRFRNS